jgi:hypothetical protein
MKKSIIAGFVMAFALTVSVFAETDYKALAVIKDIQNGADNNNQIKVLRVKESVVLPAGSVSKASVNLGGVTATNVIVSGDSKTNTIIVSDGVITSWVVTE